MTNNQLTENSVIQLLNSVRLARDNAERDDNRVDHSFYYALTIALEELQERRKADSEPVIIVGDDSGDALSYRRLLQSFAPGTKLYRHAQPAPVVQDERAAFNAWNNEDNLPIAGVSAKNAAWLAWQARAMLQAEPVTTDNKLGNSPVIPDTWIPVSERMPENDVFVLTFDGMYKRVHHAMYGHWQCWGPEKITHWMPLPSVPQEVNHG
ncbi:DUF551 domain-containing protein [Klebsiella aerogenes]|uniref:DUF551 domain-containing protein n=1 Tax=Klebsiella aerogenes TaxID=548 RepID=UPI003A8036AE